MGNKLNDKQPNLKINTGLVSLEIVAKMNNINIDMKSIIREYGINTEYISQKEIIRIAKDQGFKIKSKKLN